MRVEGKREKKKKKKKLYFAFLDFTLDSGEGEMYFVLSKRDAGHGKVGLQSSLPDMYAMPCSVCSVVVLLCFVFEICRELDFMILMKRKNQTRGLLFTS